MPGKMRKAIRGLTEFFAVFLWCFELSWESSAFYTAIRMSSEVLKPLLAIAAVFLGRSLINLLAGVDAYNGIQSRMVIVLLSGLLVTAVLRGAFSKLDEYCRAMHDDMMIAKIATLVMNHALDTDLEYFDNSAYYDKLMSANNDSYAIMHIVWNSIQIISSETNNDTIEKELLVANMRVHSPTDVFSIILGEYDTSYLR